jgi:hypothetical protein
MRDSMEGEPFGVRGQALPDPDRSTRATSEESADDQI